MSRLPSVRGMTDDELRRLNACPLQDAHYPPPDLQLCESHDDAWRRSFVTHTTPEDTMSGDTLTERIADAINHLAIIADSVPLHTVAAHLSSAGAGMCDELAGFVALRDGAHVRNAAPFTPHATESDEQGRGGTCGPPDRDRPAESISGADYDRLLREVIQ